MKGTTSSNSDFVNFNSRKNVSALLKVKFCWKWTLLKALKETISLKKTFLSDELQKANRLEEKCVFMLDYTEYSQEGFMHRENAWFYAQSFWDMCFS